MADLPAEVRLFYVGLWCVADDEGWLEWNPATIGADLFPYTARSVRERHIKAWGDALVAAGRVVIHACGCAHVPTLTKHQRIGGTRTTSALDRHRVHTDMDESGQVSGSPSFPAPARANNATNTDTSTKGGPGGDGLPSITPAVAQAWLEATGRTILASGAFAADYLDDACRRHRDTAVAAAILTTRQGFTVIPTPQQLAVAVRNRLDPLPKAKDTDAADADERERIRRRRAIEETKRATHYAHVEPDPRCPECAA